MKIVEDRRQTHSACMLSAYEGERRKQGKLNNRLSFVFEVYVGKTSVTAYGLASRHVSTPHSDHHVAIHVALTFLPPPQEHHRSRRVYPIDGSICRLKASSLRC